MTVSREDVERTYRLWFGRAVGVLARSLRDIELAEDAVQEAFAAALARWPVDGYPADPGAWIIRVARNRALDDLRRRQVGRDREAQAAALTAVQLPQPARDSDVADERLAMLFAASHPALAVEMRLPLTLRLVTGLTVPEIARALLVTEATVSQRLVRAKRRLREARVRLAVPTRDALPQRLDDALRAIDLLYNEGHSATAGDHPIRVDLCEEAIRLARLVVALLPAEREAAGLLAMLLATQARRAARFDEFGAYVPLSEHDRTRYDLALVDEADRILVSTLGPAVGPFALRGAVSAMHSRAPTAGATDWPQILGLYHLLLRCDPSPVVRLNGAVALAEVDGPARALDELDALAPELDGYQPFHAARGEMLRRAGRFDESHGRVLPGARADDPRAATGVSRSLASRACQPQTIATASGLFRFESEPIARELRMAREAA